MCFRIYETFKNYTDQEILDLINQTSILIEDGNHKLQSIEIDRAGFKDLEKPNNFNF